MTKKRRGHGEGSVFERADGKWLAVVELGWSGGRRRRKTAVARTQKEAGKRLRELQRSLDDGLPLQGDRLTVGGLLERWLRESAAPNVRRRTFLGYEAIVLQHLGPALGRIPLRKLGPADLEAYMREKRKTHSARSVQLHHAVLRRALTVAERWQLVSRNVARLVTAPRVQRPEITPPTPDQARLLLDGIRGDRLETLYAVALALGLRQSEILGLTWADVDLERSTLTVRHALQRYRDDDGRLEYHLDEPKSRRSRRTVSLPAQVADSLRQHRDRQAFERQQAASEWRGERWNLVFCDHFGEPVSGSAVTHQFQDRLKALGLSRWRFHDLRHAAATFLFAQGVPLRVAMEILGHSTIAVTADTYSHVLPQLQEDAAERVGSLLWGQAQRG